MILVSSIFLRLTTRGFARAMALYPFIIVQKRDMLSNAVLINHEKIHLRQQIELLIIPFYLWYLAEFLLRYLRTLDFGTAYRAISFEREAHTHERDPGYLAERSPWSFWRYL